VLDEPYVVRLHKNHVARVKVMCPVRRDDCDSATYDPTRRSAPKVVSASDDRTIMSFNLQVGSDEVVAFSSSDAMTDR